MAEMSTIARPYAKAAFDFAVENQAVDKWQEMLTFAAAVSENEQIRSLIGGAQAANKLAEIFIQVCGEQINEHGQNFIKVLAENGRLTVLPQVCEQYLVYRNEWAQEVEAEVVSATQLTDEQTQSIVASLEKRLARKVKLNCSIESGLIAGVIIRAGDLVIDGSIKGKLSRLTDSLQS